MQTEAKRDLLDDFGSRVQVLVGGQFGSRHDGGKGGLVLLLIGEGQGPHGAAVEAGAEAHYLTGSRCLVIVRVYASCKKRMKPLQKTSRAWLFVS